MRRLVYDSQRIGPWICERIGHRYDGIGTTIGVEKDGELIGGVLYETHNPGRSIHIHVASDGSRNWMTPEFLRQVFHYPFVQLGVSVMIGVVDSKNTAAIDFDLALGFSLEHVIPDAGRFGDLVILTMRPAQCRFLKLKERLNGNWEK